MIFRGTTEDILGAVVVIPRGKEISGIKRKREAASSSAPPPRSKHSKSSSSSSSSISGRGSSSKSSSSSSSRKSSAFKGKSVPNSELISVLEGLLTTVKSASGLEKQNEKLLKENKANKDLIWRYQMLHERLYSDYCHLYDAIARSSFNKEKPANPEERDSFIAKYLQHKTPLWQADNGFLRVAPVQITMDTNTLLSTTALSKMQETLEKVQSSKKDFVNLSRAALLDQPRTSHQMEETLDLMMGDDRYVEESKCAKLGIVPEPESEINLGTKNLRRILKSYSVVPNRFDFDYHFDEEEEEEG